MGIFKSIFKHRKIKKHSKKLEPSKKNMAKLMNSLGESNSDLDNFLDFCMQDTSVKLALNHFGADRETLRELYEKLLHFGAGQWAGSYYVPVASLCFGFPLHFLLEENGIHFKDKAVLLIEYFERNDSGPVPTQFRGPIPNDPLKPIYDIELKLKRDKNA